MNNDEKKQIADKAVKDYKSSVENQMLEFAKSIQAITLEGMKTRNKTKFYSKYTTSQVEDYLKNPERYDKQLRNVSRYLAVVSAQYWRLINYFPSIAMLVPIIVPNEVVKIKHMSTEKALKNYNISCKEIDKMSINHEFLKAIQTVFREDVFFGYEIETDDSYYIKQLNPDYCRIKGVYDGCLVFEFNFAYFDTYADELDEYILYDKEIKKKYNKFKANRNEETQWQELDLNKEVCFKLQEDIDYCCPPFVATFYDVYDIADYKDLSKSGVEVNNRKYIGLKMPYREDSVQKDDFYLKVNTMKDYFAFLQSTLGTELGLFMSPMPFEPISFPNNDTSNADIVQNAIKNYWATTGVADVLMGENKNAGTLKYSIITDEAILFKLYRQIERFLTRKIKLLSKGLYTVKLVNVTQFSKKDVLDSTLKTSEYGFAGAKTIVDALLGFSQNQSDGLAYLENEIFNKDETMIPVKSTHTQSSEEEVGRKAEQDDTKVSDSAQKTRDAGSNSNK